MILERLVAELLNLGARGVGLEQRVVDHAIDFHVHLLFLRAPNGTSNLRIDKFALAIHLIAKAYDISGS